MPMMRIASASALAILLTSCASGPPDPATFFEGRRTYAWFPGRPFTADLRADNEFVRDRIYGSIGDALEARGYRPAAVDKADLLVAAYAVASRSFRTYPSAEQEGYAAAPGVRIAGEGGGGATYESGALVLDVIDPVWKTLMWRGAVRGNIRMDVEPKERDERVRRAAKMVVDLLPSSPGGTP